MKNRESTDDQRQLKRFVEAAREAGCDEDESAFESKLKKLAKPKPTDNQSGKNDQAPE